MKAKVKVEAKVRVEDVVAGKGKWAGG
jgi:hypothetical protein